MTEYRAGAGWHYATPDQLVILEAFIVAATERGGPTPITDGDTAQLDPCPEWTPKERMTK